MNTSITPLLPTAGGKKIVSRKLPVLSPSQVSSPCLSNSRRILSPEAFAELLDQEHRRSERSHHSFILMKLSVMGAAGLNGDRDLFLQQVAGSLAAIARETDYMGWYSAKSVLGIIFTELGSTQDAEHALVSIEAKVKLALQQQFDLATQSNLPV